jgi:acetyltransferase-like isoleucine patch superfamily enzyme
MNPAVFMRRMLGRPTLKMGRGSTVGASARVLNASTSSEKIRLGHYCRLEGELFVFRHGGHILIGDWCFIGPGARIWSAASINIGNRVLISHNVNIFDSLTHPLNAKDRHEQFRSILTRGHPTRLNLDERPIDIADDVWVGASATILRGVRIGQGAVIGAQSVVTHDVPAHAVVVGNPPRIVRTLRTE